MWDVGIVLTASFLLIVHVSMLQGRIARAGQARTGNQKKDSHNRTGRTGRAKRDRQNPHPFSYDKLKAENG
jgi:hypothetical protein